ncbi:MAG: dCTP deaminase [Acidobacteria bacterium]|nr:dCTP deaminase [Acidobacteriota bacterium]
MCSLAGGGEFLTLTDEQIRQAIGEGLLRIEPFDEGVLQPASYDLRVGEHAYASSGRELLNLADRGLIVLEPGEFAIVETRERVHLSARTAAQIGLRSEFARRGLLMLSGPQIDPGFEGILVVRVINLAPHAISLPYQAPFLTTQFFELSEPVRRPYSGVRQGQTGIQPQDIQELTQTQGLTLGEVITTLSALEKSVSRLEGSVSRLSVWVPASVALGLAAIAVIVALK